MMAKARRDSKYYVTGALIFLTFTLVGFILQLP